MASTLQPNTVQLSEKQQARADNLKETMDTAIKRLAEQLSQGHTAEYLDLLAFYRSFWRYSTRNLVLIKCQKPDAYQVAGYRRWQELKRQVRQGAKAIWIYAPILKKMPDPETGQPAEVCIGFRPTTVFDASDLVDIQERPLPTLWKPLPDDVEPLYQQVLTRVKGQGIAVIEMDLPKGMQGAATATSIKVRHKLDSRNRLATLLHEYAHLRSHFGPTAREKSDQQCELEAESASYVVLHALGIPYPFSSDYLLSYQVTPQHLTASLNAVTTIVRQMMALVDGVHQTADSALATPQAA